jgi:acyl transferase domain-containing protein
VTLLQERRAPASLHLTTPNTLVDFARCGVAVVTATTPLSGAGSHDALIVSGASGFGFGGTNAHVLFREARRDGARVRPPVPALQGERFWVPQHAEPMLELAAPATPPPPPLQTVAVEAEDARVTWVTRWVEAPVLGSGSGGASRGGYEVRTMLVFGDAAGFCARVAATVGAAR